MRDISENSCVFFLLLVVIQKKILRIERVKSPLETQVLSHAGLNPLPFFMTWKDTSPRHMQISLRSTTFYDAYLQQFGPCLTLRGPLSSQRRL